MKTLADFKRSIKIGQTWKAALYANGILERDMGIRSVGLVNSVGFAFLQPSGELSYCNWPKASEISFPLGAVKIDCGYGTYLLYTQLPG